MLSLGGPTLKKKKKKVNKQVFKKLCKKFTEKGSKELTTLGMIHC